MTEFDLPYVKAVLSTVAAMQADSLPAPIATAWSKHDQILTVQVQDSHYRAWLGCLSSPEMEAEDVDAQRHLRALGALPNGTRINLVTVTAARQEARA